MVKWQRTLRVWPEWDQADAGEIPIQRLAKAIAERLIVLRPFGDLELDDEREYLSDEFKQLAEDPQADSYSFDLVMARLYDWADTHIGGGFFDAKKACWVDRHEPKATVR